MLQIFSFHINWLLPSHYQYVKFVYKKCSIIHRLVVRSILRRNYTFSIFANQLNLAMKRILMCLLLLSSQLFGQEIYLPHEVETTAEPVGGVSYINQFIFANLKIPFRSAVNGLNTRMYVKGIVEPDGSMSQLEISKGIDSLFDKEAIRVLSL